MKILQFFAQRQTTKISISCTHTCTEGGHCALSPTCLVICLTGSVGPGLPWYSHTSQPNRRPFFAVIFQMKCPLAVLVLGVSPSALAHKHTPPPSTSAGDIEDSEVRLFHCNPAYEGDSKPEPALIPNIRHSKPITLCRKTSFGPNLDLQQQSDA